MNLKQFDLLQYTNTVVETINQILNERNWTLKKLSDVSNISYDTLKKTDERSYRMSYNI